MTRLVDAAERLLVALAGAWAGWIVAGLAFLWCRAAGVALSPRATVLIFGGLGALGAVGLLGARRGR